MKGYYSMAHKNKKGNSDTTHTDPVCGMDVDYKTAPEIITYENKT